MIVSSSKLRYISKLELLEGCTSIHLLSCPVDFHGGKKSASDFCGSVVVPYSPESRQARESFVKLFFPAAFTGPLAKGWVPLTQKRQAGDGSARESRRLTYPQIQCAARPKSTDRHPGYRHSRSKPIKTNQPRAHLGVSENTVDGQNPAPPTKPWNADSRVNANQ